MKEKQMPYRIHSVDNTLEGLFIDGVKIYDEVSKIKRGRVVIIEYYGDKSFNPPKIGSKLLWELKEGSEVLFFSEVTLVRVNKRDDCYTLILEI